MNPSCAIACSVLSCPSGKKYFNYWNRAFRLHTCEFASQFATASLFICSETIFGNLSLGEGGGFENPHAHAP
jgi:hypothetical protein